MPSRFDQILYPLKCVSPQCGHHFETLLRDLVQPDSIPCPKCGVLKDLKANKTTGDLGTWFNTAAELDKLDQAAKPDKK